MLMDIDTIGVGHDISPAKVAFWIEIVSRLNSFKFVDLIDPSAHPIHCGLRFFERRLRRAGH